MNFIKRLLVLVYGLIMISVGAAVVFIAVGIVSASALSNFVEIITSDMYTKLMALCAGLVLFFVGIIVPYRVGKKLNKNKTVSFQNPDGEVTVSLSAIEEYVKKIAKSINGIKDVKSDVNIKKKGININTEVSILSGVNIPEVTERIQMEVKNRVQSMLGVDENVNITMHVKKISKGVGEESNERETRNDDVRVPFREQ